MCTDISMRLVPDGLVYASHIDSIINYDRIKSVHVCYAYPDFV